MSGFELGDALGGWNSDGNNQNQGQPNHPVWPGSQSGDRPTWPGQGGGGAWGGQPSHPGWSGPPTQPNQPSHPGWSGPPTQPNQPSHPGWSGPPTQPNQPSHPGWSGPPTQPSHPSPPIAQQNLAVPFSQRLPNGVYDKLLITIAGVIKRNASKITVDLSTGPDLAFHFNPRFNDGGKKVIVRNSCVSQKWGTEERELPRFPFEPGQPFEMKIMCTNSEFKVAVNGSHLLAFRHRITNLRSIQYLHIYYDLTLSKVQMENLP